MTFEQHWPDGVRALAIDPLFAPAMHTGRSLVFNTPYVIGTWRKNMFSPASPQDWEQFFDRNIPKTGIGDLEEAHGHLMKYGLAPNYWNEYVMEAYVNRRQDMILLAGSSASSA